jgi:hypothetical protein
LHPAAAGLQPSPPSSHAIDGHCDAPLHPEPQVTWQLHDILQSTALLHASLALQLTRHGPAPHSTRLGHAFAALQLTTHAVAPAHSMPPVHRPAEAQLTKHGTPSGHTMWSLHDSGPVQSNVHVSPTHCARMSVQTSAQVTGIASIIVASSITASSPAASIGRAPSIAFAGSKSHAAIAASNSDHRITW